MAMVLPVQFKTVEGATDLTLEADPGESFRVYGINIKNSTGEFATVTIDNVTVGYFHVKDTVWGNHLHFPLVDEQKPNLLSRAIQGGLFRPFPIACGQKLEITGVAAATSVQQLIYTKHPEGTVLKTEPNGTESREYDYFMYGRVDGAFVDGDNELTVAVNPGQFSGFPFEGDVPSKCELRIHGIATSDLFIGSTSVAASVTTEFLKLIHERTTLGDEDNNGILLHGLFEASEDNIGEGPSNIGFYSDTDMREPLMFPTPLVFGPGDDFDMYVTVDYSTGTTTLSGAEFNTCLLMTRRNLA